MRLAAVSSGSEKGGRERVFDAMMETMRFENG
jgi:hypothetical protein